MGMIVSTFDSPLGPMRLCSSGGFLTAITFTGQKHEERHIPKDAVFGTCPVLELTKQWLSQYFDGKKSDFLPPIKPAGTSFQQAVWQALMGISYGETITYGELANRIGCKSPQAVGNAVGRNPISVLIPCHRVVGTNCKLTGYAGGIEKKESLLAFEKQHQ